MSGGNLGNQCLLLDCLFDNSPHQDKCPLPGVTQPLKFELGHHSNHTGRGDEKGVFLGFWGTEFGDFCEFLYNVRFGD